MNDSSPSSSPPSIDPPSDGPRFRTFSLGTLMILVAIVAIDFGMFAALRRRGGSGPSDRNSAVLVVLSYDFLVYFTILALRKMIHPAPGERPSLVLLGIAVLVLGTCAGVPVGFMLIILLSPPR